MKNRISKYYDNSNDELSMDDLLNLLKSESAPSKKDPEVTKGEWVSVLIFNDPQNGEVIGVHVVQGKSAFSNTIMSRIDEGIYDPMDMETFNARS